MKIDRIRIVGFKSVAALTLDDLTPYSVFAGPNGAGKSNLMDALAFVCRVIESGAAKALRKFGGFSNARCDRLDEQAAKTFEFDLHATLNHQELVYHLRIHDLDADKPQLEESLHCDGKEVLVRKPGMETTFWRDGEMHTIPLPDEVSGLLFVSAAIPLYPYLTSIRVFRFDPLGAKNQNASDEDDSELSELGNNLATLLRKLQDQQDTVAQILEWLELIVPGLEQFQVMQQPLDGRTVLQFKEAGSRRQFPAHLISDGTIYALCILTAVLSRQQSRYGITLIEEPERGIHPKAITELVQFMRDNATPEHPVFVTTHSESVVRASRPDELWLMNKVDGRTVARNANRPHIDLDGLQLDQAWLMNVFNGGLPW